MGATREFLAVLASMAVAQAAPAAAPSPPYRGVWQGTVGNLPIQACFDERSYGEPYGVYYYRSRFVTIPLIKDPKGDDLFSEGWPDDPKAPRWKIVATTASTMDGSWKQGERTLPLKLTRVPTASKEEDACSSLEFEQPRLAGVGIERTRSILDGVAYTRLTLDHSGHFGDSISVETFELAGTSPAIKRINRKLKEPLAQDDWLDCIRIAFPWGGDHHQSLEPRMISRRWLVLNRHWDGYCGGAHPDSSNIAQTFDLTTGQEIDVKDWFNTKAIKRTTYKGDPDVFKTIEPAFRRVVIGRWKGDDDCAGTIDSEEWWNVELGRTGFTFTPILAHVVQACGEDFKVPFAKLTAYLTAEGRRNVAALQAESASRR